MNMPDQLQRALDSAIEACVDAQNTTGETEVMTDYIVIVGTTVFREGQRVGAVNILTHQNDQPTYISLGLIESARGICTAGWSRTDEDD